MAQANGGPGFGALAVFAGRMTVKVALNMAISNRNVLEFIAGRMYSDETNLKNWAALTPPEKAIWLERTRSVVTALGETVG
jgi:hypothetical protein